MGGIVMSPGFGGGVDDDDDEEEDDEDWEEARQKSFVDVKCNRRAVS